MEDYKIFEMLNSVYSIENEYTYSNLVIQLQIHFKENFNKSIGTNKTKELITICKNNKWLIQYGNKQPYKLGNYKNE
jgi:hypothetical protein